MYDVEDSLTMLIFLEEATVVREHFVSRYEISMNEWIHDACLCNHHRLHSK